MSLLNKIKEDAGDAGYRVCAKQMSKGIKSAIIKIMKDNGVDKSKIGAVSELLESDAGEALVSMILGYSLLYIPKFSEDPRVVRLSEEFRVGGMSTAGNFAMDIAFQYFLAPINNAMEVLPEMTPQRIRVAVPNMEENQNEDEENEADKKKRITLPKPKI